MTEQSTSRVPNDERRSRALHGLSRTLVQNLIIGVTEGYTTKMEIFGVGYRVALKGKDLEFALGYSHPVPIEAPEGITFRRRDRPTKFSVSGIDKQKVGQISANIRRLRRPTRTRVRASATRVSRSVARSERRVSDHEPDRKTRRPSAFRSARTCPPRVASRRHVVTSASARRSPARPSVRVSS